MSARLCLRLSSVCRVVWVAGALALALAATGCKKKPALAERMGGSWRASMEVGGRASKDPIVRGWSKFWDRNPLYIWLEVGPTALEITRWSSLEKRELVQKASYRILDDKRIELTTDKGPLVVGVSTGCADEGYCLDVSFVPELPPGSALPPAVEALGLLFGCDDGEGKMRCAEVTEFRTFYRYAKPDAS